MRTLIYRFGNKIPRNFLENAWSLLVALLAILLSLLLGSCQSGDTYVKPETKPLLEAVYASGFLKASDEYAVLAEGEGRIQEKLLNDGALLKKGDAIYILSADQPDARYQIARQNFELAKKNAAPDSPILAELHFSLNSLSTKKKFDSINFVRFQNLMNQNATTRVEYDRVKLTYENSINEYNAAKNRFNKTKSDLTLAFENARQQLLIAGDDSGRQVVRSLMDGRLLSTKKEVGEVVRRGEQLALIGKSDSYYLQLSVDEQDIRKLQFGQKVLFKADAFTDSVFEGVVSKIYTLVDTRQQSLRVDVNIPTTFPASFSGLAVEANIIVREKKDALVLPKNLVQGDSVWIEREGKPMKIQITKGIETMDEVEILNGLDSSSRVLIVK
ncbi:efflux RND transporter periplasmic adaptor subunit [Chryseotalea sanaruensis]|uniref:efflux RND transporter periplasmic adaptor subunit n=1 Tax=Chryseotalea sanaruensis TaxID=2482724 RepID=UPI000F8E3BF8|nr:HlyD family efflux transporter periplasmic adaptor subunit [Chryseotalea sanaruensis]